MHIVLYTHVSFQQRIFFFFFFNDTATTEIYTLSLHDALPISMIVAAVIGAWLGAGAVARAPRRFIQLGMGVALLVAAALMLAKNLAWLPPGGEALGLHGPTLVFAVCANCLLGALRSEEHTSELQSQSNLVCRL